MAVSEGPVIVAGHVTFGPGEIDRLSEGMDAVIAATRAESGCMTYTYARLREDPDTIRIFEIWENGAALQEHLKTPHMATWYGLLSEARVLDRDVNVYPFSGKQPIRAYRE